MLTAHDVVLSFGQGKRIGPLNGSIALGQRIAVHVTNDAQWTALTGLLTGERLPNEGRLEEIEPIKVQTDTNILATLDMNRSISDFLNSPDAPEYVWLERRRRALWVLVDALKISPDMTRIPLKLLSPGGVDKYCALRFLVSRAEMVIGRELFASSDPAIRNALARRWSDFTGAVLAAVPSGGAAPGPCDAQWHFDETGAVEVVENPAGDDNSADRED